jgi:hypothetical protein
VVSPGTLTYGVPKVPKGCSEGFCHFWHLLTLGISKGASPGKDAERRVIQHKRAWLEALKGLEEGTRERADERCALLCG